MARFIYMGANTSENRSRRNKQICWMKTRRQAPNIESGAGARHVLKLECIYERAVLGLRVQDRPDC